MVRISIRFVGNEKTIYFPSNEELEWDEERIQQPHWYEDEGDLDVPSIEEHMFDGARTDHPEFFIMADDLGIKIASYEHYEFLEEDFYRGWTAEEKLREDMPSEEELNYNVYDMLEEEFDLALDRDECSNHSLGGGPYTPLIKAILFEETEKVGKLLRSRKVDVNKMSKYNRGGREPKWRYSASPLWYAIHGRKECIERENIHSFEITKLLLEHPSIDINKGTEGGESPFLLLLKKILIYSWHNEKEIKGFNELFMLFLRDSRNTDLLRVYTICKDLHSLAKGNSHFYSSSILDSILSLFPLQIKESYTTLVEDTNFCEGFYHSRGKNIVEAVAIFINKIENDDETMDLKTRSIDYIVDELRECYDRRTYDVNRGTKEWMGFSFGNLSWYRYLHMLIRDCYTPLSLACRDGNLDRVEELLADPNIDINKRNRETGEFPLSLACAAGYFPIVERLLRHKLIDVNQITAKNKTALYLACEKNHVSITKLYLNHPGIKRQTYTEAFCYVVRQGNESLVKVFLEKFRETAKCRNPRNKLYRQAKHRSLFSLETNSDVIQLILNEFPRYINRKLYLYQTNSYARFVTSRRRINKKYTDITYKPISHTLFQHACLNRKFQVLSFLLQHPAFQASNEEIFIAMKDALEESCNGSGNEANESYNLFQVLFKYAKRFLSKEGVITLMKQIPPQTKETHWVAEIQNKNRINIRGELQSLLDMIHLVEINHLAKLPYLPYDICRTVGKFLLYKKTCTTPVKLKA